MSRRALLVLASILLVQSLIVAAVFTPEPHGGGDNAGYVALAHSLVDRGTFQELWDPGEPPHTKYPPVFPLLLAGAILLGAKSWGALKLIPAFSVVLAVAFTFLWGKERRGLALAAGVALLVGMSESVVYYSQWVLSDPTFLALTLAALWAFERSTGSSESAGGEGGSLPWLAGGIACTVLAYFTRSAGLPLAVAALAWLALRKRWKAVAAFAVAFGVPAALWWWRGRSLGGSQYVSEFWLLDPYQPQLGTVGPAQLLNRIGQNLGAYLTAIIPGGIIGDHPAALTPAGVGLALLALVGWIRSARKRVGVPELLLPLYLGLILVWPTPWSGDRFSLPLLPLLFFYGGTALLWMLGTVPRAARGSLVTLLALLVFLAAGLQWVGMAGAAGRCRGATERGSPMACLSPQRAEYLALAEWSGRNLPADAVVTTRKPRIFYVMSGVKARSLPLVRGADLFLGQLRDGGSRYLSLDALDGLSAYYAIPVVTERLHLFCGMVEFGPSQQIGTRLLGLLDPEAALPTGQRTLASCPRSMFRANPGQAPTSSRWQIPILVREEEGHAGEGGNP